MNASWDMLNVRGLGLVPYGEGLRLQEDLVRQRADDEIGDVLVLLEHPPVLTMGRSAAGPSLRVDLGRLAREGLEVVPVTRGGDVTWHGPGQLVGYPICDLMPRGRDLHRFLRGLEEALQASLARFGVTARRIAGRTGVWVGDEKIASIGIAVRRWVSYHGFALNVDPDLRHFDLIHPCGLPGIRMTSMRRLLGARCPSMSEVRGAVAEDVARTLGYQGVRGSVPSAPWEPAEARGALT